MKYVFRCLFALLEIIDCVQYIGDDDDDDDNDISTINRSLLFENKTQSVNVNINSVTINKGNNGVVNSTPPRLQDSDSSDDVVVEESSSEDERPLIDKETSSNNIPVNIGSDHVMAERIESEQIIGPSHLVENKNSFNIISRVPNYLSSSSDEGDDAWDDSLLAPIRPKPVAGIVVKADVEKNMQKRKTLHAKYNEFISTPLPQPSLSDRHPVGSRGKRGGRRGSQGAGRYASSGRGCHPTSIWPSDKAFHHGNQSRGGAQQGKTFSPLLSSPLQPFPQQQFTQQQFPQQQFPQQQTPPKQFLWRQFPQQFPQQQFPQQFPQQQFSQKIPHKFPHQALPPQQDQCCHNNSKPFTSIPSAVRSTSQVTANTSTNITSISQLDEKGMKNEYEWQKWMIERSVKRALEGLSEETANNFTSQLKKILSGKMVFIIIIGYVVLKDSSATTLNKFPSSKGATWVIIRTVFSHAVDKPMDRGKAVIALKEIYSEFVAIISEFVTIISEFVTNSLVLFLC